MSRFCVVVIVGFAVQILLGVLAVCGVIDAERRRSWQIVRGLRGDRAG
jgi:hypothetical protein